MPTISLAKQERVVESVRQGLAGVAAVEFVRQNGYAITEAGIARYIQSMGGLGRIKMLIEEGKNNIEILEACLPAAPTAELKAAAGGKKAVASTVAPLVRPEDLPLYETTKMTIHLPADVYEAIRLAAKAEGKTQNQLITELLTKGLSEIPQLPGMPEPQTFPEEQQ